MNSARITRKPSIQSIQHMEYPLRAEQPQIHHENLAGRSLENLVAGAVRHIPDVGESIQRVQGATVKLPQQTISSFCFLYRWCEITSRSYPSVTLQILTPEGKKCYAMRCRILKGAKLRNVNLGAPTLRPQRWAGPVWKS